MFKQPKKYYRYCFISDRRRKAGFHREIALSCSEEHHPLIRSKRRKRALYYYSDFSDARDGEPCPDQISWKHRCKKWHQWVKHHYSLHEQDVFLAHRCKAHRADRLLKYLQRNPGWHRLVTQNDPILVAAIRHLHYNKIEIKEYGDGLHPSVVDIRLKQAKENTALLDGSEWEREIALMHAADKREKHKNKRLPVSHKCIRDKYHYPPLWGMQIRHDDDLY